MKKQFIHPWAEMYQVHRRHIIVTSPGITDGPGEDNGGGFAPTRTATFGSTPTVIYGDDYE